MFSLLAIFCFIALAVGLAWFLLAHDKGEREPVAALWLVFGLGFIGAIAASFLERVIPSHYFTPGSTDSMSFGMAGAALGVGIIEEACKFLPVALFLYRKRYFNEHTDGIIYFALAGLGFGLPENILYTLDFGGGTAIMRLILTPFFHAATTSFVGYFLAKGKVEGRGWKPVLLVLPAAAAIHGVYDFGLLSGNTLFTVLSLMATFAMSLTMFLLFARSHELDQEYGLAVVGHNSFCRSCGWPNPQHKLYCQHCGVRA